MNQELPKGTTIVRLKFDVPPEKFEAFSKLLGSMCELLDQKGTVPEKRLSGKAEKTRQEITKRLERITTTPGFVKTGNAWDICRPYGFGYGTVSEVMRNIMNNLVSEGKAIKKDVRGKWEIL